MFFIENIFAKKIFYAETNGMQCVYINLFRIFGHKRQIRCILVFFPNQCINNNHSLTWIKDASYNILSILLIIALILQVKVYLMFFNKKNVVYKQINKKRQFTYIEFVYTQKICTRYMIFYMSKKKERYMIFYF
jgi:hypothetical protein